MMMEEVERKTEETELAYAGFWIRWIAAEIDAVVLGVPLIAFNLYIYFAVVLNYVNTAIDDQAGTHEINLGFPEFLLVMLVTNIPIGVAYYGLMESSRLQGTVGKLAVGIQVVDKEGKRITFRRALGRYFATALSSVFCIGYLMVARSMDKRGLHDRLAGTYVVKKSRERRDLGESKNEHMRTL